MFARRTAAVWAVALSVLTIWVVADRRSDPIETHTYLFDPDELSEKDKKEEGHAWEFFDWWYDQRAYPNRLIPKAAFWEAYQYAKAEFATDEAGRRAGFGWTSIGPNNIGGRMLAVAVDPGDPSRIWAGAASGGLWRSTSAGEGVAAWTRIETGFPSLSVSAIVIDPANTDVLYIGTGEISRYERPLVGTPGARSSYGLGILKSTDQGVTWSETGLTWTFDQSRAVLSMKMDPSSSQILWAATSEGLFKTTDAGTSWTLSHAELMAMDVVVNPVSPSTVYVSHGQLGVPADPDAGIYKTTNGGTTWTQLGGGLPTTDFGRTPLAMSADGARIFAGVSDAATRQIDGLYRSTNGGTSWQNVDGSENWAGSQAWYDNTIAVSPVNDDLVIAAGLDTYRSTTGGSNLNQVSVWWRGFDGVIPPGGSEGPSDYVHADQHGIAFDTTNPSVVYIACDGGMFKSTDSGATWAGKNGGLVTTQIYNGFAASQTDASIALAGLQDNGTIKYEGTDAWNKVFGGDGGWCGIDASDNDVLYEEYVYLNIHKSTNGGSSWSEIHGGNSSTANFIAPFVVSQSSPNVLYAGTEAVKKSTNGGSSWSFPDGDTSWNGTSMATIGISFTSADTLIAGTGDSGSSPTMQVRRSVNGGSSWTTVNGLPDRYPTDFSYDPNDSRSVWAAFSGYGTGHVFSSTDAGLTWVDRSSNLPDIPAQSVVVDPADPEWVYLGTDLGTYRTTDGGGSWADFNQGMPLAMILDLVIKHDIRRLRAATFGNGVWEIDLPAAATPVGVAGWAGDPGFTISGARPNPFREATTIGFTLPRAGDVRLTVYDQAGRRVRTLVNGTRPSGAGEIVWDGRDSGGARVAAGVYFVQIVAEGKTESAKLTVLR